MKSSRAIANELTETISYNIPAQALSCFRGRNVIVRSCNPVDLVEAAASIPPANLTGLQLLSPSGWPKILDRIEQRVSLELVLSDLAGCESVLEDFFKKLPANFQLGVTIRAQLGVSEAAKAAMKIGLPLSLQVSQPPPDVVEELSQILEMYLHDPEVSQPVDFYHSLLRSALGGNGWTLWDIQGENPSLIRHVTDKGDVVVSGRLPFLKIEEGSGLTVSDIALDLLRTSGECSVCDFFFECGGYFRLPDRTYDCIGIKGLLATIFQIASGFSSALEGENTQAAWDPRASFGTGQPDRPESCILGKSSDAAHNTMPGAIVFCQFECTNDCLFCAVANEKSGNPDDLDAQVFEFISRAASESFGSLTFSGAGEPTINPSLCDYVRFAKSKGITKLDLTTNGARLTEDLARSLTEAGMTSFCVSLHGTEDVHDRIVRRKGSFAEAMRAIHLLNDLKPLLLQVNTCITELNIDELLRILDKVALFGNVSTHSLSFPEWSGSVLQNKAMMCRLSRLKDRLAGIARGDYPTMVLDNVPLCVAPHLAHSPNEDRTILMNERHVDAYLSARNNLGHNEIPRSCFLMECDQLHVCSGVDRFYLQEYGESEIQYRRAKIRMGSPAEAFGRT